MRTFLIFAVISSLLLGGCSGWRESRVNPANWFGNSRSVPAQPATAQERNPLIPDQTGLFGRNRDEVYLGTLVDQVTDVVVEPTAGGAIVRVTGLTARQGAFDVRLTSETDDKPVEGVLTYSLKAVQPQNTPQGPQVARTLNAAKFVSSNTLAEVGTIRIVGARNVSTTTR